MKQAVLLVGHGSKLAGSSHALDRVISELRRREPTTLFHAAFLELQSPSIPEAIEYCLSQGSEEVIAIPYFVQSGKHVVQDIPQIIAEVQAKHPAKNIRLARYLDFDERMVSVVQDRILEARES